MRSPNIATAIAGYRKERWGPELSVKAGLEQGTRAARMVDTLAFVMRHERDKGMVTFIRDMLHDILKDRRYSHRRFLR